MIGCHWWSVMKGRRLKPSIVALIPARAGSRRIPGKNTRLLAGHPLIAYTIAAAQESGIFKEIWVCTDDPRAKAIARDMGVRPWTRGESADAEPDIAWIAEFLGAARIVNNPSLLSDAFAILRPTAPFRTAATIRRAYEAFAAARWSSLRAVEPVKQHPGKMWQLQYGQLEPLITTWTFPGGVTMNQGYAPWHSMPTQELPQVYVQNASLEMAWTWCVTTFGSISGPKVGAFLTEGYEGFDLNTERDWADAERLIASGAATLPPVPVARVQTALTEK